MIYPAQFCQQCHLGKDEWKQVNHLSLLQLTIKTLTNGVKSILKQGATILKKLSYLH